MRGREDTHSQPHSRYGGSKHTHPKERQDGADGIEASHEAAEPLPQRFLALVRLDVGHSPHGHGGEGAPSAGRGGVSNTRAHPHTQGEGTAYRRPPRTR